MGYVPKVKVAVHMGTSMPGTVSGCSHVYQGNPKKYSHFTSAEPVAEEKHYLVTNECELTHAHKPGHCVYF